MKPVFMIAIVAVAMIGVITIADANAEKITYTSKLNDFSIQVEDWWDVEDSIELTKFSGGNSFGEFLLVVSEHKERLVLKDMEMVNFITDLINDQIDRGVIHQYDNYGIITVDGDKAYQVAGSGQIDGLDCSISVTIIPESYSYSRIIGITCGKSHSALIGDLKESSKTFVNTDTTISKFSSNSNEMIILPYSYLANCESDLCFDNPNISINVGESVIIWNEDIVSHEIVSGTPTYGPEFLFETVILESGEGYEIEFSSSGKYDFFSNLYPWISSSIIVGDVQTSKSTVFSMPELDYVYESDTGNFEIALPYSWPVDEIDSKHITFLDFDNMGIQGIVSYMGKNEGFNSKSDSELKKWLVDYVKSDCLESCKITFMIEDPTLTNFAENHKRFIGGYTSDMDFFGVNQEVKKLSILHLINDESWIIDLYVATDTPEEYNSDFFLDILANFEPIPKSKNYMNFEEIQKSKSNSIQKSNIPNWIKNNAGWWADGTIDDGSFIQGLQFLIQEKIIQVESISQKSGDDKDIPTWVKNNAEWWADGTIDDSTFISGIEYLVNEGIILVK